MSILHSLVLGIIQGISEFFPVSSSAHLRIFQWLLGWDDFGGDESLKKAFDVALHLGTALALLVYLRKDIVLLTAKIFRRDLESLKFVGGIGLATIPAVLLGVFVFNDLESSIWVMSMLLISFGILLLVVDVWFPTKKGIEKLTPFESVLFGIAQAAALMPGVSRSGVIATAARARGFNRASAIRVAFFMALPILVGAAAYKFIDIGGFSGIPSNMRDGFLIGMVVSGVVGWFSLKTLTKLLEKFGFLPFVLERVLLGVVALVFLATPFR